MIMSRAFFGPTLALNLEHTVSVNLDRNLDIMGLTVFGGGYFGTSVFCETGLYSTGSKGVQGVEV